MLMFPAADAGGDQKFRLLTDDLLGLLVRQDLQPGSNALAYRMVRSCGHTAEGFPAQVRQVLIHVLNEFRIKVVDMVFQMPTTTGLP